MNRYTYAAALAALSLTLPGAATAQQNNNAAAAPATLVVDTDRLFADCNACRAASAQLTTQAQQYQQRAQALRGPLQTEGQALEIAVNGLNGRQPDPALQTRITNFRSRESAAEQELTGRQQTLRSIQAHVNQQVATAVGPIIEALRAARGASIVLAKGATLAAAPTIDVTDEVLTSLNQRLPAVQVTPLPQQPGQPPAAVQPQGR
jgi:outer membrane protein